MSGNSSKIATAAAGMMSQSGNRLTVRLRRVEIQGAVCLARPVSVAIADTRIVQSRAIGGGCYRFPYAACAANPTVIIGNRVYAPRCGFGRLMLARVGPRNGGT